MKYFIIAGEASGDLHAANLMRELKKADAQAEFCFLGGDLMKAQGGKMIKHYRQMAFMGFWAVLKNAQTILKNMRDCKEAILQFQPDLLILVDYPSFNLRIASFAKKNLKIPVHYYIPPKIWAWKEHRIQRIKKYIDNVYTIFPFETAFYAKHNYDVDYVGNPSVDSVLLRPNQQQSFQEFCQLNQLNEKPIIALLCGSRKQEVLACLPKMLAAAKQYPEFQIVVAGAPGLSPDFYNALINKERTQIVFGQTYELLQQAHVAVVNSGTATLETALIGTPQVVVYHIILGRFTYLIKDLIMKVKYFSLVNLVADKEVVKELIFHFFTVKNLTQELKTLLYDETYRNKIKSEYARIQETLGEPNAAAKTAPKMIAELNKKYVSAQKRMASKQVDK
jgi:lipid-A-disaccharide synthase